MTVAFEDETMVLRCNTCHRKATYRGTWSECWTAAQVDGWRGSVKDSGAWVHRCPECCKKEKD